MSETRERMIRDERNLWANHPEAEMIGASLTVQAWMTIRPLPYSEPVRKLKWDPLKKVLKLPGASAWGVGSHRRQMELDSARGDA